MYVHVPNYNDLLRLPDFPLQIKYLIIHIFTCTQQWVCDKKINKAILEQPVKHHLVDTIVLSILELEAAITFDSARDLSSEKTGVARWKMSIPYTCRKIACS